MRIVVVSGGFDPIHSGHIAYFKAARSHGDKLEIALIVMLGLKTRKAKHLCHLMSEKSLLRILLLLMK